MRLKKTKQAVHHIPWTADGPQPWPAKYLRCVIPNPCGENHLQYIGKDKLEE